MAFLSKITIHRRAKSAGNNEKPQISGKKAPQKLEETTVQPNNAPRKKRANSSPEKYNKPIAPLKSSLAVKKTSHTRSKSQGEKAPVNINLKKEYERRLMQASCSSDIHDEPLEEKFSDEPIKHKFSDEPIKHKFSKNPLQKTKTKTRGDAQKIKLFRTRNLRQKEYNVASELRKYALEDELYYKELHEKWVNMQSAVYNFQTLYPAHETRLRTICDGEEAAKNIVISCKYDLSPLETTALCLFKGQPTLAVPGDWRDSYAKALIKILERSGASEELLSGFFPAVPSDIDVHLPPKEKQLLVYFGGQALSSIPESLQDQYIQVLLKIISLYKQGTIGENILFDLSGIEQEICKSAALEAFEALSLSLYQRTPLLKIPETWRNAFLSGLTKLLDASTAEVSDDEGSGNVPLNLTSVNILKQFVDISALDKTYHLSLLEKIARTLFADTPVWDIPPKWKKYFTDQESPPNIIPNFFPSRKNAKVEIEEIPVSGDSSTEILEN